MMLLLAVYFSCLCVSLISYKTERKFLFRMLCVLFVLYSPEWVVNREDIK